MIKLLLELFIRRYNEYLERSNVIRVMTKSSLTLQGVKQYQSFQSAVTSFRDSPALKKVWTVP